MRVLVFTVVHTPLDARIHSREIAALLDAGHRVVYAAPFSGHGVGETEVDSRLRTVDLPRAQRWRRLSSWLASGRLLRARATETDVVIIHDPELLFVLLCARPRVPVVWDVHEDLASSFVDKGWLPGWLVAPLRQVVHRVERWAERHCHLVLAEEGYAPRFREHHPVVPNYPPLPRTPRGPVDDRVVYLGRVSRLRGGRELVAVGRRLRSEGLRTQVIGAVDEDIREELEQAASRGWLELFGFVPNDEALSLLDGALAGLSLLHDHANYRHSLPTKIFEYQAAGVPVISTPLAAAVEVIESSGAGTVVPFEDVDAVVTAVCRLRDDPSSAAAQARAGRRDAEAGRCWQAVRGRFVQVIEAAMVPNPHGDDGG